MQALIRTGAFQEALVLYAVAAFLHACAHGSSAAAPAPPPPAVGQASDEPDDAGIHELAETISASSAIVVATAGTVDDRAGLTHPPHEGGVTRVMLRIEHVLHGAAEPGERELWFPGGMHANGTRTSSSEDPPSLLPGDRYILFLRAAPPGRHPLVRSRQALLRIVRFGDQERVVDEYGRGVVADARAGLRLLGKISEAMIERTIARAREQGSGLEYVSQDRLVPADIERASPLSAVLALIVDVAGRNAPPSPAH